MKLMAKGVMTKLMMMKRKTRNCIGNNKELEDEEKKTKFRSKKVKMNVHPHP